MKYVNTINDFVSENYDEVVEDIIEYLLDEYVEEELNKLSYVELLKNLKDDFKKEILKRAKANAINDYLVELEDEEGENEDE